MTHKIRYMLPSLAILSLVGAASVAAPSIAFAADAPTTEDKAEMRKPIDRADDRIKSIHEKLHITADQEAKFGKLADVMRANAKDMSEAVEKRQEAEKTTTAIDDLKAYQKIAQTHADGLKDLVPAFEGLYGSLSESQKKEADELFTHGPEKKMGHKS
jgi:protein CpxP